MKRNLGVKLWSLFGVFVLILVFILLSHLVQSNFDFFESLITGNSWGLFVYVFLNIVGIVFAPVTVIPLVVIITSIWGPVLASLSTWTAWLVGSIIAFLISRYLGVPIVRKFVSLEDLYKFEKKFSIISSFWGVVFLRMIIPIEILSYGLGLFSRISFSKYTLATALGLLAPSFVFGYLGMIPVVYQIILGLLVLIVMLVGIILAEVGNDKR